MESYEFKQQVIIALCKNESLKIKSQYAAVSSRTTITDYKNSRDHATEILETANEICKRMS